jgi:hypothetical protein
VMPSHIVRRLNPFVPLKPSDQASLQRLVPRLRGDVVFRHACKMGLGLSRSGWDRVTDRGGRQTGTNSRTRRRRPCSGRRRRIGDGDVVGNENGRFLVRNIGWGHERLETVECSRGSASTGDWWLTPKSVQSAQPNLQSKQRTRRWPTIGPRA